jgi:hypothetical protein
MENVDTKIDMAYNSSTSRMLARLYTFDEVSYKTYTTYASKNKYTKKNGRPL